MTTEEMRPNLLTVVPGNINIENFVPGRVYKETLMIYNTCNVPIVLTLKSSDKNKLTISETKIRIGVNQSKKIDLIIQDKLNYKYAKTPIKQKNLFIHMKGELIDEKYEINLIYYHKNNNKKNFILDNQNNPNLNNNKRIDNYLINNPYNEIPKGYLTENPNNNINNQMINANHNNGNYENNLNQNYNNYSHNNNYLNPQQNDNEEIIALKNIINDLNNKIINLESLLNYIPNKTNKKNQFGISHNSLYIFGNNNEKEIKNKYKVDETIDNERILSRNKILELENSTLLYRIKCLEKKISLIESNKEENINEEYKINNYEQKKEELKDNNIYKNENINEIKRENRFKNKFNIYNNYNKNNINDNQLNTNKDMNEYIYRNKQNEKNNLLLNNKLGNGENKANSGFNIKNKYSYYEPNKGMNFDKNLDSS